MDSTKSTAASQGKRPGSSGSASSSSGSHLPEVFSPAIALGLSSQLSSLTTSVEPLAEQSSNKRKPEDDASSVIVSKKSKAAAYYDLGVQSHKPEPFGEPPVWANVRQNLCEAVPYYRAFQSASYTVDKVLHGFMVDKEASRRAKFIDQVMIATT